MKVREEYQRLSREELLDKIEGKGHMYITNSRACAQCTVAALYDILGFDAKLVKAASGLSGGTALQCLGTCGALSGGIIVLSYYIGRPIEKMSDEEYIQANVDALKIPSEIAGALADRFVEEYGTFICAHIHRILYGRIFCLTDPDEAAKFEAIGAHSDPTKSCCAVAGKAARWVMDILLENGAVLL